MTLDPHWDESFRFQMQKSEMQTASIRLECYDYDGLTAKADHVIHPPTPPLARAPQTATSHRRMRLLHHLPRDAPPPNPRCSQLGSASLSLSEFMDDAMKTVSVKLDTQGTLLLAGWWHFVETQTLSMRGRLFSRKCEPLPLVPSVRVL